jgi:tRNA/tmRNA/rRNA uracil-C5-methylase (TrmA/RlmC/RlmD family)
MKRTTTRKPGAERTRQSPTKRELDVTIERIVPGGMGIGHAQKMTVLVPFTAPGDVAHVSIDRVRGNTAFATLETLIEPGPLRVVTPCPHYGTCGGCDFQHLSYEAQIETKKEIIKDCFRRIGGIELDEVEVVPSPLEWGYRIRADWAVDRAKQVFGYYRRGSREVFDVSTCPVLNPALENARSRLHDAVLANDSQVEGEILGAVSGNAVSIAPKVDGFQAGLLTIEIGSERYGFDPSSFFQANASILPNLVEHVIFEACDDRIAVEGEAIDLFCGVGLFTLPLARLFQHVTGVESSPKAASFAHESAKAAGLKNVSISGLAVEQWLHRRGPHVDGQVTVVLDPPRSGALPEVLAGIVRLNPARIVYVSCDPATLARDLNVLLADGFALHNVRGFDMFPQTHHVETVATLTRAG